MKCSFKTFRDFYGTNVYYDYLSESEVKYRLGHRREASTDPYIVRVKFLSKKYVTKIAHSTEEEIELSNAGYDHLKNTREGFSMWRKLKR